MDNEQDAAAVTSVAVREEVERKRFRRSNKAIGFRVSTGGSLTLLGRKIFNVMLYHTQRLGVPGANAPSDLARFKKFYWVPLSVFTEDANYNSEASDYLSEAFRNLLDIKLHCDDEGGTGGESLLSAFRISNKTGKRGDPCWVGWALPPTIEEMAMNPAIYTPVSLYYLTTLKSSHALGLYETARRYATSPGGLTMRNAVTWWHEHLRGVPVGTEMGEYKFFKRDVLLPAINEVNALTDIDVALIEHKTGRKVTELQFKVSEKKQEQIEYGQPPVLDMETISRLVALGFERREAEEVFASNEVSLVKATLDLLAERMSNQKLPPIESAPAFFRSAIKHRYTSGTPKAKKPPRRDTPPAMAPPVEIDPVKLAAREKAATELAAMSAEDVAALIRRIAVADPVSAKAISKNPEGKTARTMIVNYLTEKG